MIQEPISNFERLLSEPVEELSPIEADVAYDTTPRAPVSSLDFSLYPAEMPIAWQTTTVKRKLPKPTVLLSLTDVEEIPTETTNYTREDALIEASFIDRDAASLLTQGDEPVIAVTPADFIADQDVTWYRVKQQAGHISEPIHIVENTTEPLVELPWELSLVPVPLQLPIQQEPEQEQRRRRKVDMTLLVLTLLFLLALLGGIGFGYLISLYHLA